MFRNSELHWCRTILLDSEQIIRDVWWFQRDFQGSLEDLRNLFNIFVKPYPNFSELHCRAATGADKKSHANNQEQFARYNLEEKKVDHTVFFEFQCIIIMYHRQDVDSFLERLFLKTLIYLCLMILKANLSKIAYF